MKSLYRITFVAILMLGFGLASFAQSLCRNDVSYVKAEPGSYRDSRCKLDVYAPEGASDLPVIVWFHGGGLTGGNKFVPAQLKDQGVVVVAVNYRLLPKSTLAETIDDAAAAVAWTVQNVKSIGGSRDKIFVSGHSAGGYLTNMLCLDKQYLAKYAIDPDTLAGYIPFSGQAITHFARRAQQGIDQLVPTIDEYAPLRFVRGDAAPILILSGDRELEMNGRYEEQAYFWRMLKLNGHKDVTIYEMQGYNHGNMPNPGYQLMVQWVKKHI